MSKMIKILVVDDEKDSRETFKMLFERQGYTVKTADTAQAGLHILEKELIQIVVTDIMMPGCNGIEFLKQVKERFGSGIEVIMATGYGSIETAVETMRQGAFGYFIKSHNPDELLMEVKKASASLEAETLKAMKQADEEQFLITSRNAHMQALWDIVEKVADSNASVLITGESGTGKEIIAHRIHQESSRRDNPFIAINCQQYPQGLIESELFGHEKGAYTGAVNRHIGKLEQAAGGTVFLDEIGDMAPDVQVKLLRVLETKEIERIGASSATPVDFRLVSATNRNLQDLIAQELFRQDLFYRINTIELYVPPLRERQEDLPAFISFFVEKFAAETGRTIHGVDKLTEDFLLSYAYPGNVRELKNMIERMVILAGEDGILSLQRIGAAEGTRSAADLDEDIPFRQARQNFERDFIRNTLLRHQGNITHAAKAIGLSRRQLFNKINELQIDMTQMQRKC